MITHSNRFHGHRSLTKFFRRSQSFRAGCLIVRHQANNYRSDFRLAVVVSKKVDKKAVVRNRIRRRIYELFRCRLPSFGMGVDMAVIVQKSDPAFVSATELEDLLQPVFARLSEYYS